MCAIETLAGWVITGAAKLVSNYGKNFMCQFTRLAKTEDYLQKFWEIEEMPD